MSVGRTSEDFDLPWRTSLAAVADPGFDRIAGVVRQVLGVPVALVSLVDRAGQVFPGAVGLPEPWNSSRGTPLSHSFCQYVVRTAEPLIVADARREPGLRENLAIDDIGVIAYAGIPLVDVDGRAVGSLCAIDTEPRTWTTAEIRLLSDLAASCSAELQLRVVAERTQRAQVRTAALLHLSETLSETTTIVDVSAVVRRLAVERLGAFFGGITLVDPHGADALPTTHRHPITTVVGTGTGEVFESREAMRERYPEWTLTVEATAHAGVIEPLVVAGRVLGTVVLLWSGARDFDDDDRAMFTALCGYTAQAVQRAELLADRHEVAATLQAAMLPALPTLPWVELAGRYFPARSHDAVGGDWYDAFEVRDGALALSVGDVEGHDTAAAAVMGLMRSTVRALTITVPGDPAGVMGAVDDVLAALPPARYATGVLGTIRPDGRFCWTNAAHPPPVLLVPGAAPELLQAPSQLPLGIAIRRPRTSHTRRLPPGSTLLLYTDGLVERRDHDMDDMVDVLLRVAHTARDLPLSELVDIVLAELRAGGIAEDAHDDDVVLFGVRLPA